MKFKIIKSHLLERFHESNKVDLSSAFSKIIQSTENFDFYLASSAVHSSNIEGNTVDFDTYLKSVELNLHLKTKEIREIEDLIGAYEFAQNNSLSLKNLLEAHAILTKRLLVKKERGKLRRAQVGVRSQGELIYLAVEPEQVKVELTKLFEDISTLLATPLSIEATFYYAAMIHLVFVNIHPFIDGNGRATRLLEKWFLAAKLGDKAWYIQSERYYFQHRATYYQNLRTGSNYYVVNYDLAIPFLLMLPQSLDLYLKNN
jgi:Fic family protein